MAITSISSPRLTASIDGKQAANQKESTARRTELRSQQATETRRTEASGDAGKVRAANERKVEKNQDTQRTRAQDADAAAQSQRRLLKAQSEKSAVGSKINVTA